MIPAWASNPTCRAALAALPANPPSSYVRSANIFGPAETRFTSKGCPALAELRRAHKAWLAKEQALLDQQYEVTGFYDLEAATAIYATPDADELVRRRLAGGEREAA